jgi:uncharacterized protein YkwD
MKANRRRNIAGVSGILIALLVCSPQVLAQGAKDANGDMDASAEASPDQAVSKNTTHAGEAVSVMPGLNVKLSKEGDENYDSAPRQFTVMPGVTVYVGGSPEQTAELAAAAHPAAAVETAPVVQQPEQTAQISEDPALPAPVSVAYVDDSIWSMLDAINAVREQYGLYDYTMADDTAMQASAVRAAEASGYVSHTRPDGRKYYTALDDAGESHGSAVSEILVCCGSTIESNLDWWMNSPGHRAIILGTSGSTMSIGYSNGMWEAMVF